MRDRRMGADGTVPECDAGDHLSVHFLDEAIRELASSIEPLINDKPLLSDLAVELTDEFGLSETARQFMAGVLRHAPETTAVTNQLVNSYKRLVSGFEAPVTVSWARTNRAALVRVPKTKTSSLGVAVRRP